MPDMDKCACGRWKSAVSERCKNCRPQVLRYPAEMVSARRALPPGPHHGPPKRPPTREVDLILDAAFERVTGRRPWP